DEPEFQRGYSLEVENSRLPPRLRFLSTLAQLWQLASRRSLGAERGSRSLHPEQVETVQSWLQIARTHQVRLQSLLDPIQATPSPGPYGSYDSLVEYDGRRGLKEQLLYTVINTCLDMKMAAATLAGVLELVSARSPEERESDGPAWEMKALDLEQALLAGDPE